MRTHTMMIPHLKSHAGWLPVMGACKKAHEKRKRKMMMMRKRRRRRV